MVTNVTSLLKTVKAVEDEATRGTRALEATIEFIKQELTVRLPDRPELFFCGDETKPRTQAALKRVRDILCRLVGTKQFHSSSSLFLTAIVGLLQIL